MGLTVHCSTGGTNIAAERRALKEGQQIIVGTPGRVLDMISKGFMKLESLKLFILDEADEILGRGFQEDIDEIFAQLPGDL